MPSLQGAECKILKSIDLIYDFGLRYGQYEIEVKVAVLVDGK